MNPLELRKIIQIGYRFEQSEAAPILDARGAPLELVKQRYWATFAFWLPAPRPFRRSDGRSKVPDAKPFELQALRDGAIVEHVQEFEFPKQPPDWLLTKGMMHVWEGLTADSLGMPFNGVPVDTTTRPTFQFKDVTKPKSKAALKRERRERRAS